MVRASLTDPSLCLFDLRDVEGGALPEPMKPYQTPMAEVVNWAHTYLCRPHPALGREGPVCPYTEVSLKRSLFWLTVHPGGSPKLEEAAAVVTRYMECFLELEPVVGREAEYKTILILFPDLPAPAYADVIDALQIALKPQFVSRGLMIGQFHCACEEPGLWNRGLRPLRSPVPLLAIATWSIRTPRF